MILTPEEQARLAALRATIADRVEELKGFRAAKRRIIWTGHQRAKRAKLKGE
jgi:hypothetical protein